MAGVDSVALPEKVGGAHMAKLIARPDLLEFLDHLSVRGDAPTNLEEIVCNKLPKQLINKSINEIQIRKETGANIVGFKTTDGNFIVNPKQKCSPIQSFLFPALLRRSPECGNFLKRKPPKKATKNNQARSFLISCRADPVPNTFTISPSFK